MAISVADGITRDPIGMPFLPDFSEMGKGELIFNYHIPSPAKIAADLFCKSFVEKSLELKSSL